ILQFLSVQAAGSSGATPDATPALSRAMDLHQRQSQWTVPDSELRESLRLAVAEVLLPAYRSFVKRYGPMIEGGKNPQKYIRHSAEDLERMLNEFFEGKNWGEQKR
ncbi:Exocyst complex component EXO70A1, partial [Bienertia sinuspersici]